MPEFCSCGAQLPPDAIFCHKCGKPQRDVAPEEAPPPPRESFVPLPPPTPVPAEVSTPPAPQALNFRNPIAVRIALLVGVVATVLGFIPLLNWLAAGFFAVYFYRRKTGSLLKVGAGARMGWITGVLMFPMWAAIFTLPEVFSGHLGTMMQEQLKRWPAQDPAVQQAITMFTSGPGLAFLLVCSLAFLFVVITCLSIAGGALGAKVVGRG